MQKRARKNESPTRRRWPSLIRYAQTGYLPIDNNSVENTKQLEE